MSEKKNTQVQSLLVGFTIIDLIAKHDTPLKFNDIHNETKITKSNLYKYLNTLTTLGVLHRDKVSGMYSLGSTMMQYGMAAINKEDIATKVNPYLQDINLELKETTLLTVWTHHGPMIVKMIHSRMGLNLGGQVGTILPIHSAAGKIFASFMDDPIFQDWKQTEQQMLDESQAEELEKEFREIKEKRIAFATEALAPSVASVAIPIFNYDDELIGSVIVVGFEKTIPNDLEDERSQYLIEKGKEISNAFGAS